MPHILKGRDILFYDFNFLKKKRLPMAAFLFSTSMSFTKN